MTHPPSVRDEIKVLREACLKLEDRIDDLKWSIEKANTVRSYDRWALSFIAAVMILMGWYVS